MPLGSETKDQIFKTVNLARTDERDQARGCRRVCHRRGEGGRTTDFQKALNSVKGHGARFHLYRFIYSVLAFLHIE